MTVIYIDMLFFLNMMVDYLLLLAGARVAGEPMRRLHFFAGALFGGMYAVALFLPGLKFLERWPCRVASATLMLIIAYGGSRKLLRQSLIFFALVCGFGGGIIFFGAKGEISAFLQRGIAYTAMDIKVILISAALCYVVLTTLFKKMGVHTRLSGELVDVSVHLDGRQARITALIDTGNTLTDPVTGRRVMVSESGSLDDLFPGRFRPSHADLRDPVKGVERLASGEWKGRFRLLPYRAVGVERGLLLAVKIDSLYLNGEKSDISLVALSPTPVSDGGGYRALIGTAG